MSLRAADTMTPKNINFHAYRVGYYIIRTYIRIYTRGTREMSEYGVTCVLVSPVHELTGDGILSEQGLIENPQ